MEVSGTISSYLESNDKYDCLFWTSYSMDPITIEFLFKNDLVSCLDKPYFHFICDKNKIDETIENCLDDPKKINRLSQMQNYLLLSHQKVDGAFHPKVLFFSSNEKVKCIVLSGNATASGILSNQDLVAKFEWSVTGSDDYRNEIASIYQFLRSFDGWNNESKFELDNIAITHPWLLELKSERVFFSDGIIPLLNQFQTTLPFDWDIGDILVFSPFIDPDLRAIIEIARIFPSANIVLFFPGTTVEVSNPSVTLPENLSIRSSGALKKTRFHAKYFAFLGKEKAYALWGSANCSYSALLSPNRNIEILIGYELNKKVITDLWPGAATESHSSAELVKKADTESAHELYKVELLDGRIEDDSVNLVINKDITNKCLNFLLFNGEELAVGQISSDNCKIQVPLKITNKVCGVYISDISGERITNALFLNNYQKIQRIVSGVQETPDYDELKKKQKYLVGRLGSEFFVLDREKANAMRGSRPLNASGAAAFWHMPQYRKRHGSIGIFGHEKFIEHYVGKKKKLKDLNGDNNNGVSETETKNHRQKKDIAALLALSKQAGKILDALKTCTKDKKLEDKIPFDRWLKGEDYMIRFFLETIDEYTELEERELAEIKSFLKIFLRVVFHTLSKINIGEYEDGMGFIRSLNMMCSLYLLLTKYSWEKMSYEQGTLSTTKGFDDKKEDLADASFLKILAENILEIHRVDRAYEAKTILLDHVKSCFHHAHAAYQALVFTSPGLLHVDETSFDKYDIVEIRDDYFIFDGKRDGNTLKFKNMLGDSKSFSAEYIQPRTIYRFGNSVRQ